MMARRFFAGVLVLGLVLAAPVLLRADGRLYPRYHENIPVDIPYQRAVAVFDGRREMLLIQTMFEGPGDEFGWLVPVPALPDLQAWDPLLADDLVRRLGQHTLPRTIRLDDYAFFLSLLMPVLVVVVCLLTGLVRRSRKQKTGGLGAIVLLSVLYFLAHNMLFVHFGATGLGKEGVDVVRSEVVGSYDVKVIQGETGPALVEWLKAHEYRFDERDVEAFQDYADRGWFFVAARLTPEKTGDLSSGMTDPLVLAFDADRAVYPMKLTGIGATGRLDLLIYVYAPNYLDGPEWFQPLYAGPAGPLSGLELFQWEDGDGKKLEPAGLDESRELVLTAFRGFLGPEQMSQDVILNEAKEEKPYHPAVYRGHEGATVQAVILGLYLLICLLLYRRAWRRAAKRPGI